MEPYDADYFDRLDESAERSARAIIPLVLEFVEPRSVVDVGCGRGGWLAVFAEFGMLDILGIDGGYVDNAELAIPVARFLSHDLREPLKLERSFDLVLSLEVAEHLPSEHADAFIESLVGLGPAVLFSAAIPHQGGTHHVNEQWPEYWAERFAQHGYLPVDCIRRRVWRDDAVDWWYAQNTLLYVEERHLEAFPKLKAEYGFAGTQQLSVVHPTKYQEMVRWAVDYARGALQEDDGSQEVP